MPSTGCGNYNAIFTGLAHLNLLAIDTSTSSTVLGLQLGDRLIDKTTAAVKTHSRDILPSISGMFADAGVTPDELDCIVFGQGPGSFTGLRIAVGIVQGLAYGLNIPVVPVSTLASLAQSCVGLGDIKVMVALSARQEEVYFGTYGFVDGVAQALAVEGVADVSDLPSVGSGTWFGLGDAWHLREKIENSIGVEFTDVKGTVVPTISDLLRLGLYTYENGGAISPLEATPVYLREQVASK